MSSDVIELTGKLLVAMPTIEGSVFAQAVIYMTEYSEKGAMGLIVNKPAKGVKLSDVLHQAAEGKSVPNRELGVHVGGPVETGRGFVLHSDDYTSVMQTLKVEDGFALTATLDILEDIAAGDGPDEALLMLGYAGWGPGQLDNEIGQNGWLICEATRRIVFELPDSQKWTAALQQLGIDPLTLSPSAGHA
ncbi:MAG: YqgE/AlgH family protein [Pseudomonadota bacterium]